MESYVSSAINCEVCGRMVTLDWGITVETVALGFCVAGWYSGPTDCEGAPG